MRLAASWPVMEGARRAGPAASCWDDRGVGWSADQKDWSGSLNRAELSSWYLEYRKGTPGYTCTDLWTIVSGNSREQVKLFAERRFKTFV